MHTHLIYCKELNYYRNFIRDSLLLPKAKVIYHFNQQICERKTKFRVLTNDDVQQHELGRIYILQKYNTILKVCNVRYCSVIILCKKPIS